MRWITIIALISCVAVSAAAEVTYQTIAVPGAPVPGNPDLRFDTRRLSTPVIDSAGRIAFATGYRDSKSSVYGLWLGTGKSMRLLASSALAAPGTESRYSSPGFTRLHPSSDALGRIIFHSDLYSTASGRSEGLFMGTPGSVELVARSGDAVPGTDSTMRSFHSYTMGAGGHIAFSTDSTLSDLASVRNSIWGGTPGNMKLLASVGAQAPGLADGVRFSSIDSDPVVNGGGQVAFSATEKDSGVWLGPVSEPRRFLTNGSPAANPSGKASFRRFGSPRINERGQIAFSATASERSIDLPTEFDGIWAGSPGAMRQVVRTGTSVPRRGFFTAIGDFAFNDDGDVLFAAMLAEHPGSEDSKAGLWLASGDIVRPVIDPINVQVGIPEAPYLGFGTAALNNKGQIAFSLRRMEGGKAVTTLWATDLAGNLIAIAREGDQIKTSDGMSFRILSLEGVIARPLAENPQLLSGMLNDNGQLVFAAYTDREMALFVASIPEPAVLPLLAVVLMLRRRAR